MARLNFEKDDDTDASSIYRDPTPQPGRARRTASTVPRPTPLHELSDKENQPTPQSGARLGGKQRAMRDSTLPSTLPTPSSESDRSNKRRRLGEHNVSPSTQGHVEEVDGEEQDHLDYYDPDQDVEERRELRRDLRSNQRELYDRRDELLQGDDNEIKDFIVNSNRLMGRVKQTGDATIDSRTLVDLSDITLKKTARLASGDAGGTGIDLDDFVSKCITFMRNGGPLRRDEEGTQDSSQPRRRISGRASGGDVDDDDEEHDDGDAFDWAVLGRRACFPNNKRPPVPGFLLGPLSVQKRVRTLTQRRARNRREDEGPAKRPEVLEKEDLERSESNTLTAQCKRIRERLVTIIEEGRQASDDLPEDIDEEAYYEAMQQYHIIPSASEEPHFCVSLFEFVVNPQSFGQTVENIFNVSFLIRVGSVAVEKDASDLPVIRPSEPRTLDEQRAENVSQHQAIFGLDFETWNKLIRAFDIKKPLIPHRIEEQQHVTAKGWYG